jgi:hypothetical protein
VANGAELPLDFCATLLNVILRLRPAKAGSKPAAAAGGSARPDVKYPALAVPDSRQRASELNQELLAGRNPLRNAACVPMRRALRRRGASACAAAHAHRVMRVCARSALWLSPACALTRCVASVQGRPAAGG